MYARLLFLVSLSLLGACSAVQPRSDAQQALSDKLGHLLADYNARHHTQVAMPTLKVDDEPAQPATIAAADYSGWSITVNRLWLKKDPCIVFKEAMAHELAHLLVDYLRFGKPQITTLVTSSGVVAFSGPPQLQTASEEHGMDWQAMALELGAHPCEEGYCPSPHPYSTSPLACSLAEYAAMHVTPPSEQSLASAPAAPVGQRSKEGM